MPLTQLEIRKELAIQRAASLKNLLTSPMYLDLKDLYADWKAEANPAKKNVLWGKMEKILNDYGFENLKPGAPPGSTLTEDQIDLILTHLFFEAGAGGPSRAW